MGDENTDPHLVTIPRRQSSRQTPGAWHHSRASGSAQTILTDTTTSPISPRPKESLHRTPAWSSVNVRKTRKAEHGGSLGPMGKSSTKLRRLQIFQGHNEGRPSALKADPQPLREIPPEDNISLRGLGGHGQPWVTPSRGADLARSSTEILARLPLSSFGLSSENSRKRGSVKRRVFSKLLSFRQPKTHPSTEPMMNEGSNLGVTSRNGKEGGSVTCSDGSVTGLLNIRNDTPEDATKQIYMPP
ncbi:hypothetical protein P152DRAFT_212047 [Eremomyces bilateralis CBS 781.70]|uniref:Uncharacterized protein n=1 Tax=Eremomyces bilateralis CBS 781.70 TaxID=1392243 RepID=A0A6G1FSE5_9PEZI|nr:uncharacterized protein P152DRAFT_212047 [Eremomyces bilateralis CBS 781.70]KAF1808704.1 hypothetical protein P152DRAFT_212047 [Eremomyces bilateralis CBS 781.70]